MFVDIFSRSVHFYSAFNIQGIIFIVDLVKLFLMTFV